MCHRRRHLIEATPYIIRRPRRGALILSYGNAAFAGGIGNVTRMAGVRAPAAKR